MLDRVHVVSLFKNEQFNDFCLKGAFNMNIKHEKFKNGFCTWHFLKAGLDFSIIMKP